MAAAAKKDVYWLYQVICSMKTFMIMFMMTMAEKWLVDQCDFIHEGPWRGSPVRLETQGGEGETVRPVRETLPQEAFSGNIF